MVDYEYGAIDQAIIGTGASLENTYHLFILNLFI
jgi:hypothetical protein